MNFWLGLLLWSNDRRVAVQVDKLTKTWSWARQCAVFKRTSLRIQMMFGKEILSPGTELSNLPTSLFYWRYWGSQDADLG